MSGEQELAVRNLTKFTQSYLNRTSEQHESRGSSDTIGGVIKRGNVEWLARGPFIEVFSTKTGQKIAGYHFDSYLGFERCIITCVSEIKVPEFGSCLLAIGIQFGDAPGGVIAVFSVQGSKILRCIETRDKITSCCFIDGVLSKRTILKLFQGCLAYGTDSGKLFLIDLNLKKCEQELYNTSGNDTDINLVPCHIVPADTEFGHMQQHHRHAKQEDVNFGIQLEVLDQAGLILSILPITPILALAIGFENGLMALYDLCDLQAFHVAYPPEIGSPLVKLDFMEPPDDPRACIYIWTFHENPQTPIAVMHSVMYNQKIREKDGVDLYEDFQSCSVRLTLPMYERNSLPISCQAIKKLPTHDDEEVISLCLLAWKSKQTAEILIFDVNQWYKEEMPNVGDWRNDLSYLASFSLRDYIPLDVWIDDSTVALFNSIQRPEEHFYPISLSFDLILLQQRGSINMHWQGLQNRALERLNSGGPNALLEPPRYFKELLKSSLIPNSSDYQNQSNISINTQRECILSVALEYNCFGMLKNCAKSWADGSHLGRKPFEGLSLSTLTEWIWQKAQKIKDQCNVLCVPLFDLSGGRLGQRYQKQLLHLSKQLVMLADLLDIILTKCREYIPNHVFGTLTAQNQSIRMAAEYQEMLQWLLNMGLLPEASLSSIKRSAYLNTSLDTRMPLVSYPYKMLKDYYMSQRLKFYKLNSGLLSPRTQSCRILYIDSFIEHCNANALRDQWMESGGNGLYPPPSLQAMLRVLLVPNIALEHKYALFLYFFLDLNMAIDDEKYSNVIQNLLKFPAVFRICPALIKTVQAFWNLDHGHFEDALVEIISPFSQGRKLLQWQQELLIEALLAQDQPTFALRVLQAPGPSISSVLELKTLLANDSISEAFQLQRKKNDADLFRAFLTGCSYINKWGVLLDLALNEREENLLEEFLRETKVPGSENIHFIYLIQRSKYIEAISYLDDLSRNKQLQRNVDLETPSLILSAYNITMAPDSRNLSDVYYNIRHKIKAKDNKKTSPSPLSSELLKFNANELLGGIYHSSVLSTDQATFYWDDHIRKDRNRLLNACNVPFLRRPQLDIYFGQTGKDSLCYPEVFKPSQKRRIDDDILEIEIQPEDLFETPRKRRKVFEIKEPGSSKRQTMEEINATLLTKFKEKSFNQRDSNVSMKPTDSRQHTKLSNTGNKLLSTPIVKRTVLESPDSPVRGSPDRSRVCTPQSILKTRSVMTPSTSSIRNVSPFDVRDTKTPSSQQPIKPTALFQADDEEYTMAVDEEKSIRFDLPTSANTTIEAPPRSADTTATAEDPTSNSSLDMSHKVPSTSIVSSTDVGQEGGEREKLRKQDGGYQLPMKRGPIHSLESSLSVSTDTVEFFSPVGSRETTTRIEEKDDAGDLRMSFDEYKETELPRPPEKFTHSVFTYCGETGISTVRTTHDNYGIKREYWSNKEIENETQKNAEINATATTEKSPEADKSQLKVEAAVSLENSPLRRRINLVEGPKRRKGLKRSYTPPSLLDSVAIDDVEKSTEKPDILINRPRLRSRSKTPDTPSSSIRKSERVSQFAQASTSSQKVPTEVPKPTSHRPLSRLVLEANAKKAEMQQTVEAQSLEDKPGNPEDVPKLPIITSVTSLSSEPTIQRIPSTDGDSVFATSSKFVDKFIETSPVDRTLSFGEISVINSSSYSIGESSFSSELPQQLLQDNSLVDEAYTENLRQPSLSTTLDMSSFSENFSFGQINTSNTNLLTDSSFEYSKASTQPVKSFGEVTANVPRTPKTPPLPDHGEILVGDHEDADEDDESSNGYSSSSSSISGDTEMGDIVELDVEEEEEDEEEEDEEEEDEVESDSLEQNDDEEQSIEEDAVEEESEENLDEDESFSECEYDESSGEEPSEDSPQKVAAKKIADEVIQILSSSDDETTSDGQNQVINPFAIAANTSKTAINKNEPIDEEPQEPEKTEEENITELLYGDMDSTAFVINENKPSSTVEDAATSYEARSEMAQSMAIEEMETANTSEIANESFYSVSDLNEARVEDSIPDVTSSVVENLTAVLPIEEQEELTVVEDQTIDVLNMPITGEPLTLTKIVFDPPEIVVSPPQEDVVQEKSASVDDLPENREEILQQKVDSSVTQSTDVKTPSPVTSPAKSNVPESAESTSQMEVDEDGVVTEVDTIKSALEPTAELKSESTIKESKDEMQIDIRLQVSDDEDEKSKPGATSNAEITTENLQKPSELIETTATLDDESKIIGGHNLRAKRARSASIDQRELTTDSTSPRRTARATSVPRTNLASSIIDGATPKNIGKRSSSVENVATPSRILTRRQSLLLDRIEEDSPLLGTPRTRRRAREELEMTPTRSTRRSVTPGRDSTTPSRSTRARSIVAEESVSTPRRTSRRLSMTRDTPTKEVVESKSSKEPTGEKVKTIPVSEAEDEKIVAKNEGHSQPSGTKTNDQEIKMVSSESHPLDDYSTTSRRLTRTQLAVLEKSAAIAAAPQIERKLRVPRKKNSQSDQDEEDSGSDTGSMVSRRSKRSSASKSGNRPVTRATENKGQTDDDTASIASSTRSKRSTRSSVTKDAQKSKKASPKSLTTIAEEDQRKSSDGDHSGDEASSVGSRPGKRRRNQRNQK